MQTTISDEEMKIIELFKDNVYGRLTHAVKSVEPNLGDFNYAA
jgi:hypothetical protein